MRLPWPVQKLGCGGTGKSQSVCMAVVGNICLAMSYLYCGVLNVPVSYIISFTSKCMVERIAVLEYMKLECQLCGIFDVTMAWWLKSIELSSSIN